jgi:magnesium transporter
MIRSLLFEGGKVVDGVDPAAWKSASSRPGATLWVDVEAPKRKTTKLLKDAFAFDDISLQDCLTFSLLPKADAFPDYVFVVLHALGYDEASGSMTSREVDLFLGRGFIVTVHVDPIPPLDKVFKEAQRSGEVLARGPALVAHVLFDRLIDLGYEMVSSFDDDIEQMEERISTGQLEGIIEWTLRVRRQLLLMKKTIGPQRDVMNELARRESPLIPREAALHFRDDYDRLARVYDQVDTNRELVAAAAEGYRTMVSLRISEISLRTNAALERLTLIATVFLPVTAVASWYGMNFTNMPELATAGFYPALFVAMVLLSLWIWRSFKDELDDVRLAEHLEIVPKAERKPRLRS